MNKVITTPLIHLILSMSDKDIESLNLTQEQKEQIYQQVEKELEKEFKEDK